MTEDEALDRLADIDKRLAEITIEELRDQRARIEAELRQAVPDEIPAGRLLGVAIGHHVHACEMAGYPL